MASAPDPASPKAGVSAASGGFVQTFKALWPYLWPKDRADLQMRVLLAFGLLVVGRIILVGVPFSFKWATDQLAAEMGTPSTKWLVLTPILLVAIYGVMRVGSAAFIQLRDAVFAPVFMHAVRKLAHQTFAHLHHLSLRFHLERKTGGLTRILERGRSGIEDMVRLGLNQLVPVIVELTLMIAVLFWNFDWRYVVLLVAMVVIYMAFTIKATEWRISIRRNMNDSDTDANAKAIDSLLNFETVKYFGAERRETARYDVAMAKYERNSVKAYQSLALLNFGQAFIFSVALTIAMWMCVDGIRSGRNTLGDFVLINALLIQLYTPLNFMGTVYREIKQATLNIEEMFNLLNRDPEILDKPGAPDLKVSAGEVTFEDVHFAYV
ncbi:MAG: ABC transporter transmembrane domain-containing protein, partial [Hyphomicrobiales bacterium]|nr:ABC transporter transmembrane domain-containing protein [Hyphomicrobiales bacterium]